MLLLGCQGAILGIGNGVVGLANHKAICLAGGAKTIAPLASICFGMWG